MTESPKRIVVGLSGGVDSAVAALRLVRAGHEVIGLFMKNWEDDDTLMQCSAEDDIAAAVEVAEHLGIPIRRVNFAVHYRREVFEQALRELRAGRTPNPDILCNRHIKFDRFLHHAREQFAADAVATGHYARLGRASDDGPALLRGFDPDKDQSYFLAGVSRTALDTVRFPLGDSTKEAIREEARSAGLPNFDRPDSTGICFIGERDFTRFLQRYIDLDPGPILTEDGREIGRHQGLAFYTLGQRRGLGIGGDPDHGAAPWYVADKDAHRNALLVVQGHDHPWLQSAAVETGPFHWLAPIPAEGARLQAQVRYRQRPQAGAVAHTDDGGVLFRFDEPQRAATPGQYLVLYDDDQCLGGAAIAAAHPADRGNPPTLQTHPTEVV